MTFEIVARNGGFQLEECFHNGLVGFVVGGGNVVQYDGMTDNPFESPSVTEQVAASESAAPRWVFPPRPVLVAVVALAVFTGLAFFFALAGGLPLPEKLLLVLIFACPAVAVLLVSFASAFPAAGRPGGRIIRRGFGLFFLILLAAVAGYIAFATTCCCVNGMALGPNYGPPPEFGGAISFLSVLIGALAVYGLHRLARKIFGTPIQARRSHD